MLFSNSLHIHWWTLHHSLHLHVQNSNDKWRGNNEISMGWFHHQTVAKVVGKGEVKISPWDPTAYFLSQLLKTSQSIFLSFDRYFG